MSEKLEQLAELQKAQRKAEDEWFALRELQHLVTFRFLADVRWDTTGHSKSVDKLGDAQFDVLRDALRAHESVVKANVEEARNAVEGMLK